MNKIEIAIFAFLLGMALMNDLHRHKDKIYRWLNKRCSKPCYTNEDYIKSLTGDELAKGVTGCCYGCIMDIDCSEVGEDANCLDYAKEWLKKGYIEK